MMLTDRHKFCQVESDIYDNKAYRAIQSAGTVCPSGLSCTGLSCWKDYLYQQCQT